MGKLNADKLTIAHIEAAKALAQAMPARPIMGAVIIYSDLYDRAKALGYDMIGYIRGEPVPTEPAALSRQQRRKLEGEGLAARKKLAQWAQRGGK